MSPAAIGVDAGASLIKLAIVGPNGDRETQVLAAGAGAEVLERIRALGPRHIGLTGCGARELAARLNGEPVTHVPEFAAWGRGALELLENNGERSEEPFLLTSVGTGTSILHVDGDAVTRVGGTALGGGTLMALARGLAGCTSFDELVERAAKGDRRHVDLLIGDIYDDGEIPIPRDATAANLGKLARGDVTNASKDDWAHAITGLVGETVALLCIAMATAHDAPRLAFGGTSLRNNAPLRDVIGPLVALVGRTPIFLTGGEAAGARGALSLALEAAA